jgi:hypothetical protein
VTALAETLNRTYQLPRHREERLPRLLAGIVAAGQPTDLRHHERTYGPLDMPASAWNGDVAAARRAAARLIDTVERSGLTGRGGLSDGTQAAIGRRRRPSGRRRRQRCGRRTR